MCPGRFGDAQSAGPEHDIPLVASGTMLKILSISGSLRAVSSNKSLLQAAQILAPEGMQIEPYSDLDRLPHFNPDRENDDIPHVRSLYARVEQADGLLISCPEYARGIPGSFKNALDWLVGSTTFPGKPIALFSTSPRGVAVQDALRLVLETMSAHLVEEASITLPIPSKELDAHAIAADPALSVQLRNALVAFAMSITDISHRD